MFNLNTFDQCSGGNPAQCEASVRQLPASLDGGLRLILLGAPGVGKGTQADLLRRAIGITQFSTGDFFRAAIADPLAPHSAATMAAIRRISEGCLVPDDMVIEIVHGEMHRLRNPAGVLLDGFPRTVPQAHALEAMLSEEQLQIDGVLNYVLPTEKVVERLAHRRVCRVCKRSYHLVELPPLEEGRCDHCHGELFQREDDRPEAVRVRLDLYTRNTEPLIGWYHDRHQLISIDCSGTPQETHQRTLQALHL
jgi:adenylate kinase